MKPRAPKSDDRLLIVGRTGSGKTYDALFNFAHRNYTSQPWIVTNTKGDPAINRLEKLEGVTLLEVNDDPPRRPGIFVIKPLPGRDNDALEDFLWKVWENERTGIYIDEGYLIPSNSEAWTALLTGGRTKEIPMIILSQRPVLLNRFAISEAQFIQVKQLTRADDKKRISEYGLDLDMVGKPLPPYYSLWYDVSQNRTWTLKPVPDVNFSLAMITKRIAPPANTETASFHLL